MWSRKPNTPLRRITQLWVLRATNYTIRQRIDARHAFNYQGIWTKMTSPLQFSLGVPLLLQVDVLAITISKQLQLSWRPQVYNECKTQLYWYYIYFSSFTHFHVAQNPYDSPRTQKEKFRRISPFRCSFA